MTATSSAAAPTGTSHAGAETTSPTSVDPGRDARLDLGPWDDLAVQVATGPYLNAMALFLDVVRQRSRGLPAPLCADLGRVLPARSRWAVEVLDGPRTIEMPDCVVPLPGELEGSVEQVVERLRDLTDEQIDASLAGLPQHEDAATVPAEILRDPRAWIEALTDGVLEVHRAATSAVRAGRRSVDAEVERVGTASVRGAVDTVLGDLSPRVELRGDALWFEGTPDESVELEGRRLVLVPMVCGPATVGWHLDMPDEVWIAYPAPGAGRLWRRPRHPVGNGLVALLGTQRAELLVLLDFPTSMGRLATDLDTAPATLTFHADRLEASGLVRRVRRGRQVLLVRTERGEELLDLMG